MKKIYSFNVLSDTECTTPGCKKRLKQRIIEEHPKWKHCFNCHKDHERARGHHMKE